MVDNSLFDRAELGFDEWSVTPAPETLVPDSVARERERESFRAKLDNDVETVIVTHTDADGLTSAALLSEIAADDAPVIQPVGYQDAYRFEHVLDDLRDSDSRFDAANAQLLIADFSPDDESCADDLATLVDRGCLVEWFDHHQWAGDVRACVQAAGVELYINTDECAASLIQDVTTPGSDGWDEQTRELVAVTKDRDLWINDDPRSSKLNTFAGVAAPQEYVDTVLEHGVDLPGETESRIAERQELDAKLEQAAVERAESRKVGEEFVAGVTYTAGGNTSNIGNELVENHDPSFDVAVVCTPSSVSFYSHSENDTFDHCHEVAGALGGGGHPTAAGCGVPADTFRELSSYWAQAGRDCAAETTVLNAVVGVVEGST